MREKESPKRLVLNCENHAEERQGFSGIAGASV
jgi:hypothetical protein